jgi:hypothetical protein
MSYLIVYEEGGPAFVTVVSLLHSRNIIEVAKREV